MTVGVLSGDQQTHWNWRIGIRIRELELKKRRVDSSLRSSSATF